MNLPITEIFGMSDEEPQSGDPKSAGGPDDSILDQFAEALKDDVRKTIYRWKESGALKGGENPVILVKLAFKEAGENIALNPEMERLYKNLKHF